MGTFLHKFTVKNLYIKKNVSDNFNFIDIYLIIFIRRKVINQDHMYAMLFILNQKFLKLCLFGFFTKQHQKWLSLL